MTEQNISLTIDGQAVTVPKETTILEAARSVGIDIPTLCWAENLTPVNVCRLCVVEADNSKALVPACSRACDAGSNIETSNERVTKNRRMVLELLDSANDLSQSEELQDDDAKREVRDGEQTERRHRGRSIDGSARPIGRIHTNGDRNGQRNDLGHHHQHQ